VRERVRRKRLVGNYLLLFLFKPKLTISVSEPLRIEEFEKYLGESDISRVRILITSLVECHYDSRQP
jgi:hypothetical protein